MEESMAVTRVSLVHPQAIVYDETFSIRFHRFGSVSPLYDSVGAFDWKVPAGSIGTRAVWNASAFDMKLRVESRKEHTLAHLQCNFHRIPLINSIFIELNWGTAET
jgi:hypothetical protein